MTFNLPRLLPSRKLTRAAGIALTVTAALLITVVPSTPDLADTRPLVVEVNLDDMVQPMSAEYIVRGIRYANQINANAVLLEIDTPGGFETSMEEIVHAILDSRVPVIAYVAPQGSRAASAGFFILLSSDVAVMAPGTHAGAAHPVVLGVYDIGKTMDTKLENDAAAEIRSIADKRGRNIKLAEDGVRQSSSYTDKECLDGHLIDAIANTPQDIFAKFDGKTIKRFNDTTTTLQLKDVTLDPYIMTTREKFLFYIVDPNIAFILGALGLALLYVEFTHPGMVAPGVFGAIALILALFAFHLLPINWAGVVLILLALVLFVLEAKIGSHGVLASGGILAMIIGSLILIDSPWPGTGIRFATSLSVTLPLAIITVVLLRLAIKARRQKIVTGDKGMIDSIGTAQTDLEPEGKIFVHGEIWEARSQGRIPKGARVRVREIDGLTLVVEPVPESR